MTSTARRIFIACAIGTLVGLFGTIKLWPPFWWLDAILGGFVSGFVWALPDIIRYAPRAARHAWRTLTYVPKIGQAAVSFIRRMRSLSQLGKWQILAGTMFLFSLALWSFRLHLVGDVAYKTGEFLFVSVYFLITEAYLLTWVFDFRRDAEAVRVKNLKKATFLVSPIGPVFCLIVAVIKVIRARSMIATVALELVLELACFLVRFAMRLFILIHSQELVLCTVDGALGVLISYILFVKIGKMQLGPTLLAGALTGGLLGVANYELVSIRILHLRSTNPA